MTFPSSCLLPPALMELTLSRACHRTPVASFTRHGRNAGFFRSVATARQIEKSPDPYTAPSLYPHLGGRQKPREIARTRQGKQTGSMRVRSGREVANPVSELEQRVQALEKFTPKEDFTTDLPAYTEEDLMSIYEDLLAIPTPESQPIVSRSAGIEDQAAADLALIDAAVQRLSEDLPTSEVGPAPAEGSSVGEFVMPSYKRVLSYMQEVAQRLEELRSLAPLPTNAEQSPIKLPVSALSLQEWQSLIRVSIDAHDGAAAEMTLDLMQRCDVPGSEELLDTVLGFYAGIGDVSGFENCLAIFTNGPPNEHQRHLHVKTHLKSVSRDTLPTTALSVLHAYEAQNCVAPMKTYTSVITNLFANPSSIAHAQARDLFTHMRYVAHPDPDVVLYTLMIRACASPISGSLSSEPERALDLWTEMVVDHQITPTTGSYNAVILACARSGTKDYVNEAFRLAKEMLDSHRDAHGNTAYKPNRKTFCALLEGAKRVGDLGRVRWILAEMVRAGAPETEDIGVDEEVMMHVFHAYASYRPPFRRSIAPMVDEESSPAPSQDSQDVSTSPDTQEPHQTQGLPSENAASSFSHVPPQSRSEVVAEAEALFNRVLEDSRAPDPTTEQKFREVQLTPRLLNSYLSIHYKHASLESSQKLFWSVFEECGISRTPRSYLEALERCAYAQKRDRPFALEFAEQLDAKWQELEDSSHQTDHKPDARTVEKYHIAYIRVLTKSNKLDAAMDRVRAFATRYPPISLRKPTPKLALRATRTSLVADRPLVRMTSSIEVPDDQVPPLLVFEDLELLHHKLVAVGKRGEIGYIKYITKSYEWALRVRRDEAMRAKPPAVETGGGVISVPA